MSKPHDLLNLSRASSTTAFIVLQHFKMSTSDPESSRGATEHSPLLGDLPPHVQREGSESGLEAEPTPEEKTSRRRYAWRMFWILLLLTVIGVFVKGWIDADETEVLTLNASRMAHVDRLIQFDLKGALKRALGGGLSGAAAMVLQVLLLMVRSLRPSSLCRC